MIPAFCFQLRAQNQVLKKGVVDEQASSAVLKVRRGKAGVAKVVLCLGKQLVRGIKSQL